MNYIKNTIRKNFTIVPNELINDTNLPDRSRFLFVLLASKPDDWDFLNKDLAASMGYSVETLRNYMKKLVSAGWITKKIGRRKGGQFAPNDIHLNAKPLQISPCQENSDSEKNHIGKNHTQTNTKHNKKEKKKKKDSFLKTDANSTVSNKTSKKKRGPLK